MTSWRRRSRASRRWRSRACRGERSSRRRERAIGPKEGCEELLAQVDEERKLSTDFSNPYEDASQVGVVLMEDYVPPTEQHVVDRDRTGRMPSTASALSPHLAGSARGVLR